MSIKILPAFEIPTALPFSATWHEPTVPYSYQIEISDPYVFLDFSGTVEGNQYESFLRLLQLEIESIADTFTAKPMFDSETGRAYFSGTGAFALDIYNDSSAQLLGMTVGYSASSGNNVTGSRTPFYFWKSEYADRSQWERGYEPEPTYFDTETDDGSAFSIGRSGSATYSDWKFTLEPQSKIRSSYAPTDTPWTYEDFVKHARSTEPFVVFTGSVAFNEPSEIEDAYR
ncbi:MAG: hypothetical protein RLP02_22840, partial [Coleofasciculus sp. C2-GNP5-27]